MGCGMEENTIFIFDAKEGDIVSRDIITDDGSILVKKNTVLNLDIISTISSHHILEINVYDQELIPENEQKEEGSDSYYENIRKSEQFIQFKANYDESVTSVKKGLNSIVQNNSALDTMDILGGVSRILMDNRNSLQLFDMLHCMRQFDDLTYVHSVNVALISSIIGQWLKFSAEDIRTLTLAGLLHDIGKLMIPMEILAKPGKLTETEYATMKQHVNLGYAKLKEQNIDPRIKEAALLHHEKCDGTGYPFGLKSDNISAAAKIIAIADVYDAMTAARVYRGAMCPFEVIRMMYQDAFTKFDPKYALPFLKNVASSYIHNDVKLSDGRKAKVILINDSALHLPTVQCGDEFIDLSKAHGLTITAII